MDREQHIENKNNAASH